MLVGFYLRDRKLICNFSKLGAVSLQLVLPVLSMSSLNWFHWRRIVICLSLSWWTVAKAVCSSRWLDWIS